MCARGRVGACSTAAAGRGHAEWHPVSTGAGHSLGPPQMFGVEGTAAAACTGAVASYAWPHVGEGRCARGGLGDMFRDVPEKDQRSSSNKESAGLVHWAPLMALEPPRVLPVSCRSVCPFRPGFGCVCQSSESSGVFHATPKNRGARTSSSCSALRGTPRSSSTTEASGRFSQMRDASTQPAVPPPTITKSAESPVGG